MRTFEDLAAFMAIVGEEVGTGGWIPIDQERIDRFAAVTDDEQWIHVDPERASAGPFGATVAHGYLTLALLPSLLRSVYRIEGVRMAVNYGLDRVRFPAPVRSGSRIRATTVLRSVTPIDGGCQAGLTTTIEVEGSPKPAAVVESVVRYLT